MEIARVLKLHLGVFALIFVGLCCIQVPGVDGTRLICWACTNITNTSECTSLNVCKEGEVCYGGKTTHGSDVFYTFGCASYDTCPDGTTTTTTTIATTTVFTNMTSPPTLANTTSVVPMSTTVANSSSSVNNTNTISMITTTFMATQTTCTNCTTISQVPTKRPLKSNVTGAPIVGRRHMNLMYSGAEDDNSETVCCYKNQCNLQLFPETQDNSSCHDQIGYDCEFNNKTFGICKKDPHHAQIVCRKFCGLCKLVDGGWSEWSNFSSCDVSCGNGTLFRERNCSNPEPKNGGLNCTGDNMDIEWCNLRDCPTHGGWARWSEWTGCSVTCGVGLQVRDRNCSDPLPDPDGFYCFGRASEEKICFDSYCEDGEWSPWSTWSECSRTCGSGLKHRNRNCTANSPSSGPCIGDAGDTQLCNTEQCSETPLPAFSVSGRPREGEGNQTISFSNVITNIGDLYNTTTGRFTAAQSGIYEFFITIEKQVDVGQAYCHLMKNDERILLIAARSTPTDTLSYQQSSNTAILHLDPDDEVYLGKCTMPETMSEACAFSGILVQSQ